MVTEIQLRPPEESQTARAGRAPAIEALEIPRHRARTRAPAAAPEGPAPGEPELPRLVTQDDPGAGLRRADVPVVRSEDLVILTLVRPVYPHEARVQGLEAIVEVEALVDEQGRVRSIEVVSNTGHDMFAQASRDAVRGCQFQPYLRDGEPSPVRARFRFKFKLI
jgi:protein TonB